MDINAIIAVLLIFGVAVGSYWYGKNQSLQKTIEESKDDMLKDFLQIFIVIAKDCIEVLTINNLNVSEDEYKELLAKKIVEVFDRDIHYDKIIFSNEEKIAFVKNYVLSAEQVVEKLKAYFKPEVIEVVNESAATETLSDRELADTVTKNNTISTLDAVNSYYDEK